MKKKPPEELTELRDARIERVDAVKGAANGTRFLIAKAAEDGPTGLVPPDVVRELVEGDTYLSEAGEVLKAEMSSAETNDLPDSDFAYIEPGGKKDESGRTVPRSLRHFQLNDAAHVRNALSRLPQSPFESKARPKVEAAARRMGIGEPAEVAKGKESIVTTPAATAEKTPAAPSGPDQKARKDARAVLKAAKLADKRARVEKRGRKLQKRALIAKAAAALPLRKGTLKNLADAHEAVLEAIKDAEDPETVQHLQSLAEEIASCMSDHAVSESGAMDGADDGDGGDDGEAPLEKMSLKKVKAAARTARLQKQALRDEIRVARARKTLAKIGRRNSSADQAHVDAIDDHAAALGATAHSKPGANAMPAPLIKAADEQIDNAIDLVQKAIGPMLEKDRAEMKAELAQASEQIAKSVARIPLPGGPRFVLDRDGGIVGAPEGQPGLSLEQAALAKVAERFPVGSIEREALSKAAGTEAIKELMTARQQYG